MSGNRADGVRVARSLFQETGGGSSPTSAIQLVVESVDFADAKALNRRAVLVVPAGPPVLRPPFTGGDRAGETRPVPCPPGAVLVGLGVLSWVLSRGVCRC